MSSLEQDDVDNRRTFTCPVCGGRFIEAKDYTNAAGEFEPPRCSPSSCRRHVHLGTCDGCGYDGPLVRAITEGEEG